MHQKLLADDDKNDFENEITFKFDHLNGLAYFSENF